MYNYVQSSPVSVEFKIIIMGPKWPLTLPITSSNIIWKNLQLENHNYYIYANPLLCFSPCFPAFVVVVVTPLLLDHHIIQHVHNNYTVNQFLFYYKLMHDF